MKKSIKRNVFLNRFLNIGWWFRHLDLHAEPLLIAPIDKCLILAPHRDDEVMGCGGLLLRYPKQCDVVCLTDGRKGVPGLKKNFVIEIRKREFEQAMDMAGIENHRMLGIADGSLEGAYSTLEKALDLKLYNHIFLPNPMDQHEDHRAVTRLMQKLIRTKPHQTCLKLVFYEIWSPLALPNTYLDISNHLEAKRELIECYESQLISRDFATKIPALNTYRGMLHNLPACEAYSWVYVNSFMDIDVV